MFQCIFRILLCMLESLYCSKTVRVLEYFFDVLFEYSDRGIAQCIFRILRCSLSAQSESAYTQVCCLRLVSDWTQPLDILSADSEFMCYYLSNKGGVPRYKHI